MRYFAQFLVPITIFLGVLYFAIRQSRANAAAGEDGTEYKSDRGTFIAILCIGSLVALGLGYLFHAYLG